MAKVQTKCKEPMNDASFESPPIYFQKLEGMIEPETMDKLKHSARILENINHLIALEQSLRMMLRQMDAGEDGLMMTVIENYLGKNATIEELREATRQLLQVLSKSALDFASIYANTINTL